MGMDMEHPPAVSFGAADPLATSMDVQQASFECAIGRPFTSWPHHKV